MSVLILPTIRTNSFSDKEYQKKIGDLWEINKLDLLEIWLKIWMEEE